MKIEMFASSDPCPAPSDAITSAIKIPRQDATSGFTREESAHEAARNITFAEFTANEISSFAFEFVAASTRERFALLKKIKRLAQQRYVAPSGLTLHSPHKAVEPATAVHSTYVLTLLSPGGNFAVRTALSDELLGISLADHIADLDYLRRNFPAAHRCVILGHFVEAFELLVLPMDHCWFATLVATHMKCFAIRTAHERVRDVGDVCAERYGNRFDDNERQFQTAGQVILRTVAAPATIVQRLVADQAAGRFKNVSDERVLPRAIERKLLPDGDGKSVIDVAMDVRCRLTAKAGAPIDIKIYNALRDAGRLCRPAAALTRGTMKAKKLDNMEFIEHLTGLTAAEAASYVAEQLVRACADIEAFVLHRLPNWTPPPKPRSQPWLKSYGFVANVLRSEAQCDRHAPKPQPGKEFDFESGAGRKQVRSMREKIKLDPKIEAAAAERFGIDPSPWFTCRASRA